MKANNEEIKKAMESQMPEWDKEALWEEIVPRLPIKEKKRRPVWFWFFSLLTFGILIAMLLLKNKTTDEQEQNLNVLKTPTSSYNKIAEPNQTSAPVSRITNVLSTKNDENPVSEAKRSYSDNAAKQSNKTREATSNAEKNTDFNTSFLPYEVDKQHPTFQNNKTKTVDLLPAESDGKPNTSVEAYPSIPLLVALPIVHPLLHSHVIKTMPARDMVVRRSNDRVWKATIDGELGFLTSSLQTTNPEYNDWLTQKKNINSTKESIGFGASIHKKIIHHLYLGAGVQYLRMNEVVTARDVQQIFSNIATDSAQYVKDGNVVIYLPGTLKQTQTKGYQIYSPNQWTRWSLPMYLSYEMQLGSIMLVPSIHGAFTFQQQFQGIQVHPNGQFIYKEDGVYSALYKKSGILSCGLGIDAAYSLSPKLRLSTGLFYSTDLNSSWNTTYAITEKFTRTGLRLGLTYVW